jgi:AcrR family transcriptional regulator
VTATSDRDAEPLSAWRGYGPLDLHPVLLHAMAAFNEHGYHGTTVRDIARRVGVTVPALYYHYENKQALLVTLLDSSIRDVLGRCRAAVAEAGDDPVDRFSAIVECIVLFMANRRGLAFLDTEIRSLEPENRAHYVALRDELERMLLDTVDAGIASGDFAMSIPVEASRAVLTMCQGVANWYDLEGPLAPARIAEHYVLLGLGTVGHTGVRAAIADPRRAHATAPGA